MSRKQLFSALMAAVCVVWVTPALALPPAQSTAHNHLLMAQSAADLGGTSTAGQPASAEDLTIDDLTPEQTAEIQAIFDTYQPQIEAAIATYTAAANDLLAILQPATPAQDLVQAREAVLTAERDHDDLVFERNLAIREVLTQSQRQTINDYVRAALGL